ncbi:hypothetical protein BDK51DRAFT_1972, partial [Blyttiomyces helicus]
LLFGTGDQSIMGYIVKLSGTQKAKITPIQKELNIFTIIISCVAITLFCAAEAAYALWLKKDHDGFETSSAAIINAIGTLTAFVPEGLPICVALSLTIIAKRMSKRKVLVKNLATIETLGCMSVLCSDKTGTLTLGRMNVQTIGFLNGTVQVDEQISTVAPQFPAAIELQTVAHLCNGASFVETAENAKLPISDRVVKGDSTDTAVLRFAESISTGSKFHVAHEELFRLPFNSKNKWMLTISRSKTTGETTMYTKGAPDVLFTKCSSVLRADGSVGPLDKNALQEIVTMQENWSSQGMRVLAFCKRNVDKIDFAYDRLNDMEKQVYAEMSGFTLVGLCGIRDPPRPDVAPTVEVMRRAGVRVFMVTGDFKLTAVAIAQQVGIITTSATDTLSVMRTNRAAAFTRFANAAAPTVKPSDDDPIYSLVVEGSEIAGITTEEWNVIIGFYKEIVFARTTPEQKLLIVEEVKARGDNTVAVTGDGVNDAPALKAADIGVAMGAGSDVAKEAAAIILLNDDFASIPVAIENGRLVFDNLKKVLLYLMPMGSYTEFMPVFANAFLGMQPALSSYFQVMYCVCNDVPMSICLMFEKSEADLMRRKPRNARTDRLTDWRFFVQVYLFVGLFGWMSAMGMWFLYWAKDAVNSNGQHISLGISDLLFAYEKWPTNTSDTVAVWPLGYGMDAADLSTNANIGSSIFYVAMVIFQFGALLATRNRRVSLFQSNPLWGPRQNLWILFGYVTTICVAIINLYVTGIQTEFGSAPIPTKYWFIPFGFAGAILACDEVRKLIVRVYPNSIVAKAAW